jgi:hypothetical protein
MGNMFPAFASLRILATFDNANEDLLPRAYSQWAKLFRVVKGMQSVKAIG